MRKISEYTLKKATEHITYEVWMFFGTMEALGKPIDQISRNVLLESYAIHCRNLFLFLYPSVKPKDDDIVVYDYLGNRQEYNRGKTPKIKLKFILRKANKQVAHLTYSRNKFGKKTKPWPFVEIGKKIHKSLIAFHTALPEKYQSWPNFIHLKNILDSTQV